MQDDWIIQNLRNTLETWNGKLAELWQLITMSPQEFKGGRIWNVMVTVNGAVKAIGLALLVLFFVIGVTKTAGSLAEIKRPEHAIRLFIRFAIAKGLITYGMDLMTKAFTVGQGIMGSIMRSSGISAGEGSALPEEIVNSISEVTFIDSIPLWAVTLIGGLAVTVLSFIMIMTVYGRFFRIYMFTALAPIPLATFAGEPTQRVGMSFVKSYAAVLLEGAVIVLACVIFSAFASSPPTVDAGAGAVTQVWKYLGELAFNILILVFAIQGSDRIIREMMGL